MAAIHEMMEDLHDGGVIGQKDDAAIRSSVPYALRPLKPKEIKAIRGAGRGQQSVCKLPECDEQSGQQVGAGSRSGLPAPRSSCCRWREEWAGRWWRRRIAPTLAKTPRWPPAREKLETGCFVRKREPPDMNFFFGTAICSVAIWLEDYSGEGFEMDAYSSSRQMMDELLRSPNHAWADAYSSRCTCME